MRPKTSTIERLQTAFVEALRERKDEETEINEIKKRVDFHIEENDYFGTLATILSLLCQKLEKETTNKECVRVLNNQVENLMYLQNKYKIVKKQ